MRYEAYARTDCGRVRQNNEDNFYFSGVIKEHVEQKNAEQEARLSEERLLFAVCDGMGGEECGEFASLAAVQVLHIEKAADQWTEARQNVLAANRAVCEQQTRFDTKHIGTTLAALAIDGDRAVAYNLGDSRVYYFRKELTQLTHDHSLAAYLVEIGMLIPEQAQTNVNKNSLMKYLGMDSGCDPEPTFSEEVSLQTGDLFLLCSDGLWGMVNDLEISEILNGGGSCRQIGDRLVEQALHAGGTDNITVIVIKAIEQ